MGRSLEAQRPPPVRTLRYLVPRTRWIVIATRFALVLLFLALLHGRRLFSSYRSDLRAKYSATRFGTSETALWRSGLAEPELPRQLLDHRQQWKILGTGWEGQTFAFNGSVIKTFVPDRSPFRNCVPRQPAERWPTEIPASLKFGGTWDPNQGILEAASANGSDGIPGFLPVKGYFMASSSPGARSEWHLVTPLLPGGNLNNLAKKLKQRRAYDEFCRVDAEFRPAFNKLLATLEALHSRGFCHDDIKPGNIFIENNHSWILGDLGNIRHVDHPFHSSGIWLHDNNQLADCRANDAFRALKTYLQFIRGTTVDTASFDTAFLERKESLSRFFWSISANATSISATELGELSEVFHPEYIPEDNDTKSLPPEFSLGRWRSLSNAVDEALQTSVSEKPARRAAMTWILGVPVDEC